MSKLSSWLGTHLSWNSASNSGPQINFGAGYDEADVERRASDMAAPAISALNQREAEERPFTAKDTLAGFQGRGFGLGRSADQGVGRALDTLSAGFEAQRQAALNNARTTVASEEAAKSEAALQQAQIQIQQQASRPWWQSL